MKPDELPSGRIIGQIGPELPPIEDPDARLVALLRDAFEAGYASCVRDCERGHTMGQLGDWLSEYEQRHPPKVTP